VEEDLNESLGGLSISEISGADSTTLTVNITSSSNESISTLLLTSSSDSEKELVPSKQPLKRTNSNLDSQTSNARKLKRTRRLFD